LFSVSIPPLSLDLFRQRVEDKIKNSELWREYLEMRSSLGNPNSNTLVLLPAQDLIRRAKWLKDMLDHRVLTPRAIQKAGGPDPKTTKKILNAESVSEQALGRLAKALSLQRIEIP